MDPVNHGILNISNMSSQTECLCVCVYMCVFYVFMDGFILLLTCSVEFPKVDPK